MHVWGEERYIQSYVWGNLTERDHLQDPGVDGNVILRWTLRKWDVCLWTESIWLRIVRGGGRELVNAVMNLQVP